MRGHNICFPCEIRNIISELSPIPLPIWSSDIYMYVSLSHLLNRFYNDKNHIKKACFRNAMSTLLYQETQQHSADIRDLDKGYL